MKISILLILVMCAGCVRTRVVSPDGWMFDRVSFLQKTQVGNIIIPIGTNQVRLEAYANDGVAAAAQITEAAMRGAVQGIKP